MVPRATVQVYDTADRQVGFEVLGRKAQMCDGNSTKIDILIGLQGESTGHVPGKTDRR